MNGCTSNLCRMNGCMFPQACPISTTTPKEHRMNRLTDRLRESLNAGRCTCSSSDAPGKECPIHGEAP